MWLKEALRVFTRLTAIKPPLQNHFVNTMYLNGYIKLKKENFRLGESSRGAASSKISVP